MIANQRDRYGVLKKIYPDDKRPWVPSKHFQCHHTVCPSCHREKHRVKSWVSLNGVLNGDILPSVATGLSFNVLGSRPVVKASVAEMAGCRPVPLVSSLLANASCVDGNSNAAALISLGAIHQGI